MNSVSTVILAEGHIALYFTLYCENVWRIWDNGRRTLSLPTNWWWNQFHVPIPLLPAIPYPSSPYPRQRSHWDVL